MQRGVCTFQEKADTAVLLGYDAYIIFNDAARGDALVTMAVESPNHPGIFVGHSTGKKLFGDTVCPRRTPPANRCGGLEDRWLGLHPALGRADVAQHRHVRCAGHQVGGDASGVGTMSVHEITFDRNVDLAYLAYYDAGFRVLK
jgi:hypothetical protein